MPPPKAGSQSRRYCGTIFFPTDHSAWADAAHCINTDPFTRFFICQPEMCPDTHKLHVQFYIEFAQPKTMSACKAIVGQGKASPHIESCIGTQKQNMDYVRKEESNVREQFPELTLCFGTPSKQGNRSDIHDIGDDLISGKRTLARIVQENPGMYIKYANNLERLQMRLARPRQLSPKRVVWLHGPTGTGKTRSAFTLTEGQNPYVWGPSNGRWWDGYQLEGTYDSSIPVIMDEFRGDLKMGYMLQLLDAYPLKVEFKGGMCQFVADTVYITSPKHPQDIYQDQTGDRIGQFLRRITEIRYFHEDGTVVITKNHFEEWKAREGAVEGVPLPQFFS